MGDTTKPTENLIKENHDADIMEIPIDRHETGRDSDDSDRISDADELGGDMEDPRRNRREKRLYMNRESARARRKRKKALMETLEQQVTELSKRNQMYRLLNESLTAQVQQLESDLAVANATNVMLRTSGGNSNGNAPSHMFVSRGALASSNPNANIHQLMASTSRSALDNSLSAAASELGLSGGHDAVIQRQRDLHSQLSQVNIDTVLANFLQHQQQQQHHQQQPSLALSPSIHRQIALTQVSAPELMVCSYVSACPTVVLTDAQQLPYHPHQDTLASAVELGRLRAAQSLDDLAGSGSVTDRSNLHDPRKAALEAILKYHQQQESAKQRHNL